MIEIKWLNKYYANKIIIKIPVILNRVDTYSLQT